VKLIGTGDGVLDWGAKGGSVCTVVPPPTAICRDTWRRSRHSGRDAGTEHDFATQRQLVECVLVLVRTPARDVTCSAGWLREPTVTGCQLRGGSGCQGSRNAGVVPQDRSLDGTQHSIWHDHSRLAAVCGTTGGGKGREVDGESFRPKSDQTTVMQRAADVGMERAIGLREAYFWPRRGIPAILRFETRKRGRWRRWAPLDGTLNGAVVLFEKAGGSSRRVRFSSPRRRDECLLPKQRLGCARRQCGHALPGRAHVSQQGWPAGSNGLAHWCGDLPRELPPPRDGPLPFPSLLQSRKASVVAWPRCM